MRVFVAFLAMNALLFGVAAGADPVARPLLQFNNQFLIAVDRPVGFALRVALPNASESDARFPLKLLFSATAPDESGSTAGERRMLTDAVAFGAQRDWLTLPFPAPPPALEGLRAVAPSAAVQRNPWDIAHELVDTGQTKSELVESVETQHAGVLSAIEPDMVYLLPLDDARKAEALEPVPVTVGAEPSFHWPVGDSIAWHLEPAFTQLSDAREHAASAFADPATRILVAHLDTGAEKAADGLTPKSFDGDHSRNFVRDNGQDPVEDHWQDQVGHGTGTLSILAGGEAKATWNGKAFSGAIGGAPLAHVVTYRISNSVIHIWPSAMSEAVSYAADQGVDVISMSAGGTPSLALRDAVNKAYLNGVAMFFASGDFYRFPLLNFSTPASTVYPARFTRTISVCGATSDRTSYGLDPGWLSLLRFRDWTSWMTRGSYGPSKVMEHSIAAYSPNITRHHFKDPINSVDLDFSGTSAATPQVAAAAALWLQMHRHEIETAGDWRTWRKAQGVYDAVTSSADHTFAGYKPIYFGAGTVRADTALGCPYSPKEEAPPAKIGFDWLTLIATIIAPSNFDAATQSKVTALHQQMLASEVGALVATSRTLQTTLADESGDYSAPPDEAHQAVFVAALRSDPRSSKYLRDALKKLVPLNLNESKTLRVSSRVKWNGSGIGVGPNETYRITLDPPGQRWVDFFIPSKATGYSSFLTNPLRCKLRQPKYPFFALLVAAGEDESMASPAVVQNQDFVDFNPPQRGELLFFANDLPPMYWNNFGSIRVRVTRIH
ncbi:MAG: S8/S53 family peptidase [Thermoanaerobaculia bacterium]